MINHKSNINILMGSRGSLLARKQVEEVHQLLSQTGAPVRFDHKIYQTHGDQDKTTPLTQGVPDNFFTDALDQALLQGEIEIAIHSAKDLPKELPQGLRIFALTKSPDETDAFVGSCKLAELKPGSKIGTSSDLRAKNIRELYPESEIVEIRGTIEERIALVDSGVCDGVVIATVALKRLGLESRISDIFPWEGWPLQGQLAVVGRNGDKQLLDLFAPLDIRKTYGSVTLVGAGPGDPDLITIAGMKALQTCDCVFYDYLAHPDLLKYAPQAEKVSVGKRKGAHSMPQDELCRLLRQKAVQGKKVVRLKGGDPLIFARGADEMVYLSSYHIPVSVVPGVSSATGIPSSLGVPLTARGLSSSVAFVTAHGHGERCDQFQPISIPDADSLVFLMGLTKLPHIIETLMDKQWDPHTPVMIISRGTYVDEQILEGTLADIEQKANEIELQQPALIIVSETVRFWQKPAKEEAILYTGTLPQKYEGLGRLVHFPMIAIESVELDEKDRTKIKNMNEYDMVIFTSRFAVEHFFTQLKKTNARSQLDKLTVAVIGEETLHTLEDHDVRAEILGQVETSEGLFDALMQNGPVTNKKILFPRSSIANPFLKEALQREGAMVDEVVVYQNVKPIKKQLPDTGVKRVIFTSPSTVKNFINDYGQIPSEWKIYSRGPKTQTTLEELGYQNELLVM